MRAVFLERDRRAGRQMARVASAAGYTAVVENPENAAAIETADVLIADCFDGDQVVNALRRQPRLRGVLLNAEPIGRALELAARGEAIANICGRPDFQAPPASWELLLVLRKLAAPQRPVEIADVLAWGAAITGRAVATTADREAAIAETATLTATLGVPGRAAERIAEVAHELLMNAMYGAPVDGDGIPQYAGDRRAELSLSAAERPQFSIGTDGVRLAIQVADPFGRLERTSLFSGLARGLAGEQDRSRGGAGLGLALCHDASIALVADVARGARTAVTAVFDLELNLRELRARARSLHYFSSPGRSR